jgi:hypothetical protein
LSSLRDGQAHSGIEALEEKSIVLNWYFGWISILTAFVTGAGIGLFFYRDDFLGGYGSFRRRILRLGHIAQAALGMMNLIAGVDQLQRGLEYAAIAQWGLVVGGITMPLVCFLSAWRPGCRHLFFIPVIALIAAAVEILQRGPG